MINIFEKIEFYLNQGYSRLYANSKVAQDIILSQIAQSIYKKNVTIKGGVVLFNITGDKRRATEDIDIDFIRYSLEDESIKLFFHKLSNVEIGINIEVLDNPILLKHQSYQGKRVKIQIKDSYNNLLNVKMDIGIQNNLNIRQEDYLFNFESLNNKLLLQINSKEQIFTEKLLSLVIHKIRTTRYKDIFDMYYFISETDLNREVVNDLFIEYIFNNNLGINEYEDLYKLLKTVFSNSLYLKNVNNPKNNWLEVDAETAFKTILNFISSFIVVGV